MTAYQPAGLGIRALATIVDNILLFVITNLYAFVIGSATSTGFSLRGSSFFTAIGLWVLYYILFEYKMGATPGKLLFNIGVIRADGTACDLRAAIIRTLFRVLDGILFYFVGFVVAALSQNRQRIGDLVAGTLVVRK